MKRARPVSAIRQANEAVDLGRNADQGVEALAVAVRASCRAMVKPRLGMNGNGCAGSTASGVRIGKTCAQKILVEPDRSCLRQILRLGERRCPSSSKLVAQLVPALLLVAGKVGDGLADRGQLLGRRQAVRASHRDVLAHLAEQAGDAHHEELVEIAGRNRQEAQLLEQRVVLVRGLLQHAAVELRARTARD